MIRKIDKVVNDRNIAVDNIPTQDYSNPDKIYLPLTNGRCPKGEIFVNEGDYVKLGQVVGRRNCNFFDQNIHSTVSGTFTGTTKKFYRNGRKVECIVIENDKKDEVADTCTDLSFEDVLELTGEEIFELVKNNSVVGLGGSGFPSHIKLKTTYDIDHVILNGVECEPYLTSDTRLLKEQPEKVIQGLIIMKQFFKAKRAILTVKEDKVNLIAKLRKEADKYPEYNVEIVGVRNYYPQGYEKAVIKSVLNLDIPVSELPMKYGVMVINTTTSAAILEACRFNRAIIERYYLINGDGVNNPTSFTARIGSIVADLLKQSGGVKDDGLDKSLIIGGPMMGTALAMDDVVITKASSSALVLSTVPFKEETCVRCGTCVYSCPVGLSPVQLMNAAKTKNKDAAKGLNALDCMECGLCAYSCTSKIHVTEWVRKAKPLAR